MNKSRVAVPSFLSLAISEERSSNSKEVSVKASEAKATDNTLYLEKTNYHFLLFREFETISCLIQLLWFERLY